MSKKLNLIALVPGLVVYALTGCASNKPEPHVGQNVTQASVGDGAVLTREEDRHLLPSGKIAGQESAMLNVESTVDKIDYKTRELTLRTPKGEKIQLVAGPEIRNFNQIKTGDKVSVAYMLSLAFEVRQPTEAELAADGNKQTLAARSQLGSMPAGGVVQGKVNIATVESIDMATDSIVLKGRATGGLSTIKAKYPENLAFVKKGDTVVITSMEGIATSVKRVQ